MPDGTTHAKSTLALAAVGGFVTYRLGHPLPEVLAFTGGALAGLLLTPDLDVDIGSISHTIVRRSGGCVAETLWTLFWRPYSLLIPHRSMISHLPVVGTAVRLIYILIVPAVIWWLSSAFSPHPPGQPVFPAWGWWAVGGLMLSDTLHFLMDQTVSRVSRALNWRRHMRLRMLSMLSMRRNHRMRRRGR